MPKTFKQNKNNKRGVIITLAAITLILATSAGVYFFHVNNKPTDTDKNAQTTSKVFTAQNNYNGGSPRSGQTNDVKEGVITDNKGSVTATPPSSQWTPSANGNIVVYSPGKDSILHSGDTLSGTAAGDHVNFRLIDNVSGIISQGNLNVVNGKFAGTFNFSTKATEGRVDVFSQAPDGTESNNVSIQVKFQ